jgi:hypothetical protein
MNEIPRGTQRQRSLVNHQLGTLGDKGLPRSFEADDQTQTASTQAVALRELSEGLHKITAEHVARWSARVANL